MPRLPILIVALVAIALYARIVSHEHVLDDQALIPHQPALRDPLDFSSFFLGRYWGPLRPQDTLYRPLTLWTLAVDYGVNEVLGLPGSHPATFRLSSVLFHAAASALLFVFAFRIGLSVQAAFLAALLFAAHPIHTEAVASAVNRSESLALVFGLGFLCFHHARRALVPGALCLLGALFSKESALTFLPLAVWLDWTFPSGVSRFPLKRYAVYGAALLVWFALRSAAIGTAKQAVVMIDNPLVAAPFFDRLLSALHIQFDYLRLQVFPVGLSSDYAYRQIPIVTSVFNFKVVALCALVLGGFILMRRSGREDAIFRFAFVGYAVLFAVTANVFLPIGTMMGERLAYAPSACLCLLAGYGFSRFRRGWTVGLAAVLVLSVLTLQRLTVWATPDVFYRAQVRSAPNSTKAHYGVARHVFQPEGMPDSAIAHYRRAVSIWPNYPDAWNNLGLVLKDQGRLDEAIEMYQTALKWHTGYVQARVNLGQAYQQLGAVDQAETAYRTALTYDSTHAVANNNLAVLYAQSGQYARARALFERAIRHHPSYASARENLARMLQAISP